MSDTYDGWVQVAPPLDRTPALGLPGCASIEGSGWHTSMAWCFMQCGFASLKQQLTYNASVS